MAISPVTPTWPRPEDLIPHRPPFLLLDRIVAIEETSLTAETTLRAEEGLWSGVYAGHYPGHPVTPGVLLCEMVFQAAAAYLAHRLRHADAPAQTGVPILTRIGGAKFREMVRPGDTVTIVAQFKEQIANAFYMDGTLSVRGKTAVKIEYTVALLPVG
jgi:3-hydroxyacyl-[acyl-carrier-protein] dehydratase